MKEGRILSAKVNILISAIHFVDPRNLIMQLFFGKVQVKKHIKKGQQVSMGFGFLEFDTVETATNVCSNLQVIVFSKQLFARISS